MMQSLEDVQITGRALPTQLVAELHVVLKYGAAACPQQTWSEGQSVGSSHSKLAVPLGQAPVTHDALPSGATQHACVPAAHVSEVPH